jgi:uncharacterized membrane-anchored protein
MKRLLWHGLITIALLGVCNGLIWRKENVLARGTPVLLKLAPVDPRSLMQGDYMQLRYEIATSSLAGSPLPARGKLVLRRDANAVATFVRVGAEPPPGPGELLLKFHRNGAGQAMLGAESFFFEEGQAEHFTGAKYGELMVAPDGGSVLVGLRDAELRRLPLPR